MTPTQEKTVEVYESWLKTLLRYAKNAENAQEPHRSTAVSALIGYAQSAEVLLKYHEN